MIHNDMLTAIKSRRTIKTFKPDPIREEDLLAWLEAASFAPNHRMNEPWEILRIGTETRAKLNHKRDFGGAPLVLAVLSQPGETEHIREENIMAVSCFVQNFMLAAHAAGAGVFWSSIASNPEKRQFLDIPDDYDVIGVLGIGYPAEIPEPKPRTPITDKIKTLP